MDGPGAGGKAGRIALGSGFLLIALFDFFLVKLAISGHLDDRVANGAQQVVGTIGGIPALALSLAVLPAAIYTAVTDKRPKLTFQVAGLALAVTVITYLVLLALK